MRTSYISTHSLTKRLTRQIISVQDQQHISTHSLTKRLTGGWAVKARFTEISTHSLTKRLTKISCIPGTRVYISTHSLTKRLTGVPSPSVTMSIFQLTASRRGWRRFRLIIFSWLIHFNSQPHEEADCLFILWLMVTGISTHSLTKWLTTGVFYMENSAGYFNSQPHEEADSLHCSQKRMHRIFQLTASRRGWQEMPTLHRDMN